ncbi:MAG: amidohydrolase family protein, partial [Gemmatimonas sp.]
MMRRGAIAAALLTLAASAAAQRPRISANVRQYVTIDTLMLVLTHARVIDGTGAPPRDDQTIVVRDGRIAALGDAASIQQPAGAQVIDLTGKSVIPGLVMMHEHLYYPSGSDTYSNLSESFTRLYLA